MIFPGLIAMVIVAGFLMGGFTARSQLDDVKNGRSAGLEEGLGILGVQAYPARITGTIPDELEVAKRQLMYLGHANGKLVVFDVACDKPLRLPDDGLAIVVLDAFPAGTVTDCKPDLAE